MEQRFSYFSFGIGVAVGAAAGAVLGMLLAPQSGQATREHIANRAADLRLSAQELIENAKDNLELAAGKLEGVLGLQERNLRRRLGELKAELEQYDLSGA